MNATEQKRAGRGGEVGPNGEWYNAGAFIATTENPKAAKRKAGSGKQQVAPYQWEVAPEGMVAIFGIVGTQAEYIDRSDTSKGIRPFPAGVDFFGGDRWGRSIEDLCAAYNRGERWTKA